MKDPQFSAGLGVMSRLGAFSKDMLKMELTPTFLRKLLAKDPKGKSHCDSIWLEICSCFVLQENLSGP